METELFRTRSRGIDSIFPLLLLCGKAMSQRRIILLVDA